MEGRRLLGTPPEGGGLDIELTLWLPWARGLFLDPVLPRTGTEGGGEEFGGTKWELTTPRSCALSCDQGSEVESESRTCPDPVPFPEPKSLMFINSELTCPDFGILLTRLLPPHPPTKSLID